MEILAEICDNLLLGTPGRSRAEPKHEIRIILRNQNLEYGIFYDQEKWFFHFPEIYAETFQGHEALIKRWIPVFTGCGVENISYLCLISENSLALDRRILTYYYVVDTAAFPEDTSFLRKDLQNPDVLYWMTLYNMKGRLTEPLHQDTALYFSQMKDGIAFARYYQDCPEESYRRGRKMPPGLVDTPITAEFAYVTVPELWQMKRQSGGLGKKDYEAYSGERFTVIGPSKDGNAIG